MSFLVAGASGFIGKNLLDLATVAAKPLFLRDAGWIKQIASFKPNAIIHLAGFAHTRGPEAEVRKVNVGLTKTLAEEAARNGVKRFIFLSSIQAVAEKTADGRSATTQTPAAPQGAYGKSKLEAEQLLRGLSMESRMEVVIIRPPLVYGPGVKANFRNLLGLVEKGLPIPLAAMNQNRRSFVAVSNLIDLILLCLKHPAAANQTFHVSDDDDISTAELLRRMGKALGKPFRNLPIPASVLKAGLRLAGKGEWVDKLFGDLRVDIEHTKKTLGWKPKVTMEEELERTAKWWRSQARD
ncbi:MAG: NAD-dependent epimerase/dehydratase family protein [Proteobacteria bacterium]|nr:NAD-dependent epimerase/dehydratase family protein [Pseudomonadota bacterium]NBS07149.1 NAD-dependent epimerase/dehydratase family protein [Verrucomicrobiota bacterium]NBS49616.1 NAD-dependent epimerase/dehydratase family protein [Verrucomicrobiota bacterium]NBS79285.1 NAD-dependent epimerase/dehydratase family protein [bacterium]